MTIACATHFSPTSDDAVHVAATLARRSGERLILASVLPEVPFLDATDGHLDGDVAMHLELEAGRLRLEGVEVGAEVLHGPLDSTLSRLCLNSRSRILVTGDSSHPQPMFLDGPLDQLVGGVPVPMLVVRSVRPFDQWIRDGVPLRVLLAVDQSWSSRLAREWVWQLAEFGPLALTACHVWHPMDEMRRRGILGPLDDRLHNELLTQVLEETQSAMLPLPDSVKHNVRLEIGHAHIAERLMEVGAQERADLLVLGTHRQRSLLGQMTSVSHHVLADALMSVAFIPEQQLGDTRVDLAH